MSMPQSTPDTKPGSGKVVAAWVLAILAIFILPIILGPIGAVLGFSAAKEGNPSGRTAGIVAIVTTVIGTIGGILYFTTR